MPAGTNLSRCESGTCDREPATTTDGLRSRFCTQHQPDTDAMSVLRELSRAVVALNERLSALESKPKRRRKAVAVD